jgi:eukaryotic-like serine/threonine-protein kinase
LSARIKVRAPRERESLLLENRTLAMLVVAVGLAAFLIGFAITALAFTGGRAPADVVMVPDVREMQIADARRSMSAAGLGVELGDSFPNPLPVGTVLAQSPLPGREVSPGIDVRLVLSSGPPRPSVPDVEAMPLALATRALQTAGFDVRVEEAPGEGSVGRVVAMNPAAGTPLQLPATVVLRVGAGAPLSTVPGVIGMLEDDAREALLGAGLSIGGVDYQSSEFGEAGGVVSQ